MRSLTSLSAQQLRRAADIQERIETLTDELSDLLGATPDAPNGRKRGGNRLSAAGRAALVRAAKARWAKAKGRRNASPRKGRRRMNAAAKARLAELARARWKKAKAEGKSRL